LRRFLLADDDNDDQEIFREALFQIDPTIECYCFSDGQELINKLTIGEPEQPDILFLDINMPGMSGW